MLYYPHVSDLLADGNIPHVIIHLCHSYCPEQRGAAWTLCRRYCLVNDLFESQVKGVVKREEFSHVCTPIYDDSHDRLQVYSIHAMEQWDIHKPAVLNQHTFRRALVGIREHINKIHPVGIRDIISIGIPGGFGVELPEDEDMAAITIVQDVFTKDVDAMKDPYELYAGGYLGRHRVKRPQDKPWSGVISVLR